MFPESVGCPDSRLATGFDVPSAKGGTLVQLSGKSGLLPGRTGFLGLRRRMRPSPPPNTNPRS